MELAQIKNLDIYYLIKQDLSGKSTNSKSIVSAIGIHLKSQQNKLDYQFEYTLEDIYKYDTSESQYKSEDAFQYHIEVGYQLNKIHVGMGSSVASEHFDQLYPTGHKWLGYADLFKRQNITQKILKVDYQYSEKTLLILQINYFR